MRLADRAARFYAPMVHSTAALDFPRLVARRRLAARRGRDGDRRAHHHLSLRAGAGDPGRAGGRLGRAVPLRRHLERRRRHRAAGRGRHRRLRQDRHADAAGAARRQCRRDRSGAVANGGAAGAVEPASFGGGARARRPEPYPVRRRHRRAGAGRARHARRRRSAARQRGVLRHRANRRACARRLAYLFCLWRPRGDNRDQPEAAARRDRGGAGAARARARSAHSVGRPRRGGAAGGRGARHRRNGRAD